MNPLNYASLEASKRLAEAGIVLETEAVWHLSGDNETYFLQTGGSSPSLLIRWGDFPAPCMAEVWRELPERENSVRHGACLEMSKTGRLTYVAYIRDGVASCDYANANPTDALINLLIWVKQNRKEKERNVSLER